MEQLSSESLTNKFSSFESLKPPASFKEIRNSLQNLRYLLKLIDEAEYQSLISDLSLNLPEEGVDFYSLRTEFEIKLIQNALGKTNGNQRKAAELLNLKITTLNAMIKRYQIDL